VRADQDTAPNPATRRGCYRRKAAISALPLWLLPALGVVSPLMREVYEMRFQWIGLITLTHGSSADALVGCHTVSRLALGPPCFHSKRLKGILGRLMLPEEPRPTLTGTIRLRFWQIARERKSPRSILRSAMLPRFNLGHFSIRSISGDHHPIEIALQL